MYKDDRYIEVNLFSGRNYIQSITTIFLSLLALNLSHIPVVDAHGTSVGSDTQTKGIEYTTKSIGTQFLENKKSDVAIKILVEQSNLGSSELELGEIFLPAGLNTAVHSHGAIEIFYVLSGQLEHVVNGVSHLLESGMVGIVRPEDSVSHRVPEGEDCRALVIWTPAGEVDRIKKNYNQRVIE